MVSTKLHPCKPTDGPCPVNAAKKQTMNHNSRHMTINTMIFLTHHNYVWHPESLYGVSWLQPTSKVNGGNPGSWLRWSMLTWWTTPQSGNLVLPFHDNSGLSWTVSFRTGQGHCCACRKTWCLTDTDLCSCGETQTMSHIVESCPLTKLNGGLFQLHSADDAATAWLTNFGS